MAALEKQELKKKHFSGPDAKYGGNFRYYVKPPWLWSTSWMKVYEIVKPSSPSKAYLSLIVSKSANVLGASLKQIFVMIPNRWFIDSWSRQQLQVILFYRLFSHHHWWVTSESWMQPNFESVPVTSTSVDLVIGQVLSRWPILKHGFRITLHKSSQD